MARGSQQAIEARRKRKAEKKKKKRLALLPDRTKFTSEKLREADRKKMQKSKRRRHKDTIKIKVGMEYKDRYSKN